MNRIRWSALVMFAGVALGLGCQRQSATPQLAFRRVQDAVAKQDPGALFDALDQRSRWAWMTVQKSHREAYDIILSNYPEGPERERELRRFQKGAMSGSARDLFVDEFGRTALAAFPSPLPDARFEPAAPVGASPSDGANAGDGMSAVLPNGTRLLFVRGPKGGWGLGQWANESQERQNHALHDVDMVRASAVDYERAAARNAH